MSLHPKTPLRLAFEAWADANGHFTDEHYYFQGSQVRREYPEAVWLGWHAHAHALGGVQNCYAPDAVHVSRTPCSVCQSPSVALA